MSNDLPTATDDTQTEDLFTSGDDKMASQTAQLPSPDTQWFPVHRFFGGVYLNNHVPHGHPSRVQLAQSFV